MFYLFLSVVFDSASYIKTFGLTEAVFRSLLSIKSRFSPCWWRLLASGGEKDYYLKNFRPDGGGESRDHLIFGFAMIPTGILIIFPPFPPHRFLSRRTAHYPILLLFRGLHSGAKPGGYIAIVART